MSGSTTAHKCASDVNAAAGGTGVVARGVRADVDGTLDASYKPILNKISSSGPTRLTGSLKMTGKSKRGRSM